NSRRGLFRRTGRTPQSLFHRNRQDHLGCRYKAGIHDSKRSEGEWRINGRPRGGNRGRHLVCKLRLYVSWRRPWQRPAGILGRRQIAGLGASTYGRATNAQHVSHEVVLKLNSPDELAPELAPYSAGKPNGFALSPSQMTRRGGCLDSGLPEGLLTLMRG